MNEYVKKWGKRLAFLRDPNAPNSWAASTCTGAQCQGNGNWLFGCFLRAGKCSNHINATQSTIRDEVEEREQETREEYCSMVSTRTQVSVMLQHFLSA